MTADTAAETIRTWLTQCKKHDRCLPQPRRTLDSPSRLPSRLLHVGKSGEYVARLVATSTVQDPRYFALSYCWGDEHANFTTRKATLEKRKHGILEKDLPRTILDAIQIALKLGVYYLWVDALCIIQGDEADWAKESDVMGFIYMNAELVLSATSSKSVHDGMINVKKADQVRTVLSLPSRAGIEHPVYARRSLDHRIMTFCRGMTDIQWQHLIQEHYRLLSRGWVFQERNLASRIVHFTTSEMIWECRELSCCECGDLWSKFRARELGPPYTLNNMQFAIQHALANPESTSIIRMIWREIVKSYSPRNLTEVSDRLPALSGLATSFAKATGDDYLAGIWRNALPFDLLWRCDQSKPMPKQKSRAPSWSWSSVDCGITWPNAQSWQHTSIFPSQAYFEEGATSRASVLNAEARYERSAYGAVDSGLVTLKGQVTLASDPRRQEEGSYGTMWSIAVNGRCALFWPDMAIEYATAEGLLYIEIMTRGNDTDIMSYGLIMSPSEIAGYYQRIGTASILYDDAKMDLANDECKHIEIQVQ